MGMKEEWDSRIKKTGLAREDGNNSLFHLLPRLAGCWGKRQGRTGQGGFCMQVGMLKKKVPTK